MLVQGVIIQDRETAEHFLLCCSKYQEERDELKDTVSQVLESAKHGKDLQFSYSLLLAHTDVITQKHNIRIQESCAIAKMTAQCALHMGAMKIFGTS